MRSTKFIHCLDSLTNFSRCLFWILGCDFGFWEVFLDSGPDVVLDSGKCFGYWDVFWILGSVFGWEVFWNLGSVLSLWATVEIALHSKNFGAEDGFQQEISDCGFCGNVSDWRCFKPIQWVYHLLSIFVYPKQIIFFTCISRNWSDTHYFLVNHTLQNNEVVFKTRSFVEYGFSKAVLKCFHHWWCYEMQNRLCNSSTN